MNTLQITGTLYGNAELRLRRCALGPPHLALCLRLRAGRGFPIIAMLDLGPDESCSLAAREQARQLRRGMTIMVEGSGLVPQTDHADAVLLLLGASVVEPAAVAQAFSASPVTEAPHG